ncbi:MAG: PEP/pyruvate-binding domain-containing protein, partial [Acetobacteraceae bacterium]
MPEELIAWFENLGAGDVPRVGGKNASLGEMTQALGAAGIRVPAGFATTAAAYRAHVAESGIAPKLAEQLAALQAGKITLQQAGQAIRHLFLERDLSPALA